MTSTEPNSITVLTYLKITCLHIIYKEKACSRFRRSRTKGVNAHARSCVRKRQFTFRFYGGRRARTIVLIVVNNSFDFIWSARRIPTHFIWD